MLYLSLHKYIFLSDRVGHARTYADLRKTNELPVFISIVRKAHFSCKFIEFGRFNTTIHVYNLLWTTVAKKENQPTICALIIVVHTWTQKV